jgi:hypothetical protein
MTRLFIEPLPHNGQYLSSYVTLFYLQLIIKICTEESEMDESYWLF